MIRRNVIQAPAPRSAEAASSEVPIRRSRAVALLKTTTMQNVAWPTMIVNRPAGMPSTGVRKPVITDCSARPVTMPGSAIGRMTSRLTAVLPKKS